MYIVYGTDVMGMVQADCDDTNPCTIDNCVDAVCQQTLAAEDNNPCTDDTCDPTTGAISNTASTDGDLCTYDICDPATGMTYLQEIVLFKDDFTVNQGWAGDWQIGSAAASSGSPQGDDPGTDNSVDGDGIAGTVNGGFVADNTTLLFTSPAIDVSGFQNGDFAGLRVFRWLNCTTIDQASISISVNGQTSPLWSNETLYPGTTTGTGNYMWIWDDPNAQGFPGPGIGWFEMRFDITNYISQAKANGVPIRILFSFKTGANASFG